MPVEPIVQQLTSMRNTLIYYTLLGKHKEYAALRKEFAKNCIAHKDKVEQIEKYDKKFGIFTYYGLNIAKIWFLELFRKKTPEEKQMKQLGREIAARKKAGIYA